MIANLMEKEKLSNLRGKFLKFLPKAAPAVAFQSPPISPRKTAPGKGLSGPVVSIIPKDARQRLKNGSFDAREPGSPIVSCIGQVKNKKKKRISKLNKQALPPKDKCVLEERSQKEAKRDGRSSAILQFFKATKQGWKSNFADHRKPLAPEKVPSLGNMAKFASARGALTNFDWREQVAVVVPDCSECSDEEIQGVKKIIIPHSAPSLLGSEEILLEPKKEINLWKRRTITPPPPLRL